MTSTMRRTITTAGDRYRAATLDLVQQVFAAHKDAAEGALVRRLVEEIRGRRYYVPELDLVMVNEADDVIGCALFSRFHLEGRYEDRLLLLSPVAVRTELQRTHISKELLEEGFARAAALGFRAVIVEGDPANYRARGFESAFLHGITPSAGLRLPRPECLMVRELAAGALRGIHGELDYAFYDALR